MDHASHLQTPLPLVLAPPPCIYRNRILQSLNQAQRACRIVYLSSSYNGISAAVRAGIGVTVMVGSATPTGSRTFAERDGLPNLGQLELRLHRAPGSSSEALSRLEEYIAGSFASSVPTRGSSLGSD
jgi:DNA-binding transcriptional LysR family regulator